MLFCVTAGALLPGLHGTAAAQASAERAVRTAGSTDTVRLMANPHYAASSLRRLLFGDNHRKLWLTPIDVPVLDVRRFAGGLEILQRGGGQQSITLHVTDAEGWRWIFRSVDKYPGRGLPGEVQTSAATKIVQDHISALHPGASLVLPPLLTAAGILHVQPTLFIMPDDPWLGEHRAEFAGMLGGLELRASEGEDDTPGFAGSRKVKGSEAFLDDLEETWRHQLNQAEFLRARLVDFVVGDTDRGTDQWRWARFDQGDGWIWRPIPIDRDWAFGRADGLLARVARVVYPKLDRYRPEFADVEAMTYSSHVLDRRLLTRLTAADVAAEAERLRAALTDSVIDAAVAALPAPYAAVNGPALRDALRARRDGLAGVAMEFYAWLATDVDVRGTDEDDYADIERRADGTVAVRLWPRDARDGAPYYERVFLPHETQEIRLYLHGGDDHARVHGVRSGPILVRIIGGGSDDLLEDEAGGARLYDHRGDNRFVTAPGTQVDSTLWDPPAPPEGLRSGSSWAPDWGGSSGIGPTADYRSGTGFIVGLGYTRTAYGFRRLPHHWKAETSLLYAPSTREAGVGLNVDYRLQNSRRALRLDAVATQLEPLFHYGFGNDAPAADALDVRVPTRTVRIAPALRWQLGPQPGRGDAVDASFIGPQLADSLRTRQGPQRQGSFSVGPVFGWRQLRPDDGAPDIGPERTFAAAGAEALLDVRSLDRTATPLRGYRLLASAAAHPLTRGSGAYGSAAANGTLYVPLARGIGPAVALRIGGERVFGDFPVTEAADLGGTHTLRGYATRRFAGDASVHGGAELRLPIDTVNLGLRGELGVFGLTEAGRVWYGGVSPAGWHTAWGGGLWFGIFRRALSVAVVRGEDTRGYLCWGCY